MKELEQILRLAQRRSGKPAALATVVRTHGSSYRAVGTRMLVTCDAVSVGAVSAGCLEDDIKQRAAEVISSGTPMLVPYDTRRLFGCEGRIEVLIERVRTDGEWSRFLAHCFETRTRGVLLTVFESEDQRDVGSFPLLPAGGSWEGSRPDFVGSFEGDAAAALTTGRSIAAESAELSALLHVVEPPVHLVVAGGAYDAAPLVSLARGLGWKVTVLARPEDDTTSLAEAQIMPVTAPDEWPLRADYRTAGLIMTHHFGRDAAFLRQMLRLPFGYVGVLGPRQRRERLLDAIVNDSPNVPAASARTLHNPAGLDIGAETPEEIALAIVSEIQAVMTQSAAGFLSLRKGPIHRRRVDVHAGAPDAEVK